MRKFISLLALSCALTACASTSSTENSWACRAVGNTTCASISQIDNDEVPHKGAKGQEDRSTVIFGAEPAAWWDRSLPTARTRQDDPRRESDQTMRIVLSPFIDAQGDYHDRMSVFAVMRKADWWVVPPETVQAQPKAGTRLDSGDTRPKTAPKPAPAAVEPAGGPGAPLATAEKSMAPPAVYAVTSTIEAAPALAAPNPPQSSVPAAMPKTVTMQPIPDPAPTARRKGSRHRRRH
jgi:conjugal transfer pilus assembly protein TraV